MEPYERHASGYARELDPTLAGAVERMVELADARPGIRLLDLATGTGTIARAAAARGSSVVAVDASARMLEVARSLEPDLDLRLGDAYALPLGDDEFDVVTCGLSLSHFGEPERALREVMRVLRRPGRLVASAWAAGSSTPSGIVAPLLDRHAAAGDRLDEETWSSGARGAEILRRAGFASVSVLTETFHGAFAGADEALAWATAWPLAAARIASLAWTFAFVFYVADAPRDRASRRRRRG